VESEESKQTEHPEWSVEHAAPPPCLLLLCGTACGAEMKRVASCLPMFQHLLQYVKEQVWKTQRRPGCVGSISRHFGSTVVVVERDAPTIEQSPNALSVDVVFMAIASDVRCPTSRPEALLILGRLPWPT